MNNSPASVRFWIPLAVFLVLLAAILATGSNQDLFLYLNHLFGVLPAPVWSNLTLAADAATGFALMSFIVQRHGKLVFWAIWGAVICAIMVRVGKVYFDLPRPPGVLSADQFRLIGDAVRTKAFPSGHTATAFFVAGIFASLLQSKIAYASIFFLAILLGLSRIAVGVHWPADLMAGAFIGWSLSNLTVFFASRRPNPNRAQQLFAIFICIVGALYLIWFDSGQPAARVLQLSVGILSLFAAGKALFTLLQTTKDLKND